VNNALVFPGVFRGVLDVRARAISCGMAIAAAKELVAAAREKGLTGERLLPSMDDWRVAVGIAAACGAAAVAEGLAACPLTREESERRALAKITEARAAAAQLKG
jgi:malate dehydrogenase (oxaloacetate-decarboxylating)